MSDYLEDLFMEDHEDVYRLVNGKRDRKMPNEKKCADGEVWNRTDPSEVKEIVENYLKEKCGWLDTPMVAFDFNVTINSVMRDGQAVEVEPATFIENEEIESRHEIAVSEDSIEALDDDEPPEALAEFKPKINQTVSRKGRGRGRILLGNEVVPPGPASPEQSSVSSEQPSPDSTPEIVSTETQESSGIAQSGEDNSGRAESQTQFPQPDDSISDESKEISSQGIDPEPPVRPNGVGYGRGMHIMNQEPSERTGSNAAYRIKSESQCFEDAEIDDKSTVLPKEPAQPTKSGWGEPEPSTSDGMGWGNVGKGDRDPPKSNGAAFGGNKFGGSGGFGDAPAGGGSAFGPPSNGGAFGPSNSRNDRPNRNRRATRPGNLSLENFVKIITLENSWLDALFFVIYHRIYFRRNGGQESGQASEKN